jgi:uncharacterized membrane protein YbhN (UPF0104 family)
MRRAVQAIVAVALLAVLWHLADGAQALALLGAAHPGWLAAALAALVVQTALSAWRWRLVAGRLGLKLAPARALGEYWLAQAVNMALPGGVLGDAARAARSRGPAGLAVAAQAVVVERLAGQAGLVALLAAGLAGTGAWPGGFDPPGWLALPVAAVLLAGGAVALLIGAGRLPGAAGRALRGLRAGWACAVAAPGARGPQVMLSLGTAACNVAAFACAARAVGADLGPGAALVLVPLVLCAMLLPLAIGGWGLREGAAVALLPLAGLSGAQALAASLAFGLILLVSVLPGVAVLLAARRNTPSTSRPETLTDPSSIRPEGAAPRPTNPSGSLP